MSMSIPLVWDEVIWLATWGTYLGRSITNHAIVDGGLLSNFPLELFVSDEPQVARLMGPKQNNPVLGLLIDESLPLPPLANPRGLLEDVNIKPEELRTVQRLLRLVNAAITAAGGNPSPLLPLITSASLIDAVVQRADAALAAQYGAANRREALDAVVRLVISHIVNPGGPPDMSFVTARLLA